MRKPSGGRPSGRPNSPQNHSPRRRLSLVHGLERLRPGAVAASMGRTNHVYECHSTSDPRLAGKTQHAGYFEGRKKDGPGPPARGGPAVVENDLTLKGGYEGTTGWKQRKGNIDPPLRDGKPPGRLSGGLSKLRGDTKKRPEGILFWGGAGGRPKEIEPDAQLKNTPDSELHRPPVGGNLPDGASPLPHSWPTSKSGCPSNLLQGELPCS